MRTTPSNVVKNATNLTNVKPNAKPVVVDATPAKPVVDATPAKPVVDATPAKPVVDASHAKSPVEEAKSPVEEAKSPVEEAKSPVEEAKSPVEEAKSPVEEAKSPVVDATPAIASSSVVDATPANATPAIASSSVVDATPANATPAIASSSVVDATPANATPEIASSSSVVDAALPMVDKAKGDIVATGSNLVVGTEGVGTEGVGTEGVGTEGVGTEPAIQSGSCLMQNSIFSSVPPKCINPGAVPQLRKLVEAAFYQPIAAAGGELVSNALELTGNAALVEAALATALTPEQAAMLKNMSDNPEVAKTLAEIRDKLSVAVAQSIETAKQTVAPQVEEATGEVVNGVVVSIMNAVSDIPGVGIILSLLGFMNTGVKAIQKMGGIQKAVGDATQPITYAIAHVSELANTLNNAQIAEGENQRAPGAPGEVVEPMGESVNEKNTLPAPQVVEATTQKLYDPNQPFARTQTEAEEEEDNARLGGGGSRKRRRIHKLSRRIERTLRRVQKKYGLGLKDKNSFLRRTLHKRRK
jgi:hypothetical protein